MSPSVEPTSAPDPAGLEPADWPALWRQILQRHATASGPEGATPLLTATTDQGWHFTGVLSAASADLFELYKPLLDVRMAPSGHSDA
ncbi:MAG: hypothetical protein ACXW2G_13920, partial [Burkholderiaceae bacterium]